MNTKCFFCEFDQAPSKGKHEQCNTCKNSANFQLKARMTPSMLCHWEDKTRFEREFLSNVEPFDEKTARMVLDDICEFMSLSPSSKKLSITLDKFDLVRKKYLDSKKEISNGGCKEM